MSEQSILHQIRVLDFGWVLAGPYATRMMADFGAEVIKVQPRLSEAEDIFSRGYYNTWNRNKLGITLNLAKPAGIKIVKRLVTICDAVVENFSPRVMENWGLDYPELVKIRPDIVLLSLSAMGHTGPWRDYAGFGPTIQAFSGITSLTTYPDHPPLGLGYSYADHVAGLYAGIALLGALEYRLRTGEGQFIDLSQTETMTSLMADSVLEYARGEQVPIPVGNRSLAAAPQGIYPCLGRDRWCAISVTTDTEWMGFKRALKHPAWSNEARFSTLAARLANIDALDERIIEWTTGQTADAVMTALQNESVPAGIVQNVADLSVDPQLQNRGFFVELGHPLLGKKPADASPIRLSDNPAQYRHAAPLSGQDNDYIFRQLLGFSEVEINQLRQDEVI